MIEYLSRSPQETVAVARQFSKSLEPNALLCLRGDLGAGKTTFIKGVATELALVSQESVHSPTFVYLNIYKGPITVYHFDLYRLKDLDEFLSMGFEEYFYVSGVCCIEWAERIDPILPQHAIDVVMTHRSETERHIVITPRTA